MTALSRPSSALPLVDADVRLHEAWLAPDEADTLLRRLVDEVPWEQRSIVLFGRRVLQPRLIAWYGDPGCVYTYSGLRLEPIAWRQDLDQIRARIAETVGAPFNCVLLNLYRDGRDSMGWHSDDEPELGPHPTVASLSLGAVRRFQMRHRGTRGERFDVDLGHGSLLVMAPPTQAHWQHAVPKRPRSALDPRVNLTFRHIA